MIVGCVLIALCSITYGCAAAADSSGIGNSRSANRADRSTSDAQPPLEARPAAIVNGRPVTWGELRPMLNELAGTEVLQELILDRAVAQAASSAGIEITDADVDAERMRLLESLSDDPDRARRLLASLRERQGLGRVRFDNLLRRNASLRAIVRDRVDVTDADVRRMYDVMYGPKRQSRLLVVPDLQSARAASQRIAAGEPFADVAAEVSIDASAPRGGLLEPFSRFDLSYPESFRSELWKLEPGEVSPPILLEGQYALLTMVREIGPREDVALDAVRPQLQRQVRLNRERVLMDELARRLISEVTVTIFDDALNESWNRRERTR